MRRKWRRIDRCPGRLADRRFPGFVLLGLLTAAAGQSAPSSSAGSIRLGLLLPPEEAEAACLREGVQLAIDDANHSEGAAASVVIRGRTGQWGADGEEAGRLVLDEGVAALIAPRGGAASHLVLQVAGRTAVPVLSLCPDTSVTGAGIPWMLQGVPDTEAEAKEIFSASGDSDRASRWGAFVPEDRAGRETAKDLNRAAAAAHVHLETPIQVKRDTADFSTLQGRLPQPWPEGILVWLDPVPAGYLAKYLRTAGFQGLLAGPGHLRSQEFLGAAGSAAEGFAVPTPALDDASRALLQHFETAFRERFGRSADATSAMAYDAARLLVDVLRGGDGRPAHTLFPPGRPMSGVTGPLAFDRAGRRVISLNLVKCRDGRFVPVQLP